MNNTHSPLPWNVRPAPNDRLEILAGEEPPYWLVCRTISPEEQDTANARYIVTACNAYPALVEALEALLEFADNGTPINPGALAIADARAALALARGGAVDGKADRVAGGEKGGN